MDLPRVGVSSADFSGHALQLLERAKPRLVQSRDVASIRLVGFADLRHAGHRRAHVVEAAARHATQHRGTQQHGLFRLRGEDGLSCRIGEQLANEIESPGAAADHHALDRRTGLSLGLDDLAQAVTNAANAGNVEGDQAVQIVFHAKARNHGSGVRVSQRGTVAEELGDDM